MIPPPSRYPRDVERVPLQLYEFLPRQIGLSRHLLHVFIDICPEIRRVIGVDGDFDALPQERDDFAALEVGGHHGVGDRTARQSNALLQDRRDQLGGVDDVGPVVEAVDLDFVDRLVDVGDAVGLVNVTVCRNEKTLAGGALEYTGEFRRWVVPLVGVETYTDDAIFVRQRLHQGRHGVFGGVVPEETHDE